MESAQWIEASERSFHWLDEEIVKLIFQNSDRARFAIASLCIARETHKAIVLLFKHELNSPASALWRTMFESYIRGIWIWHCASDGTICSIKKDKNWPPIQKMLSAIESRPGFDGKELSDRKKKYWDAMNSFTHCGLKSIIRQIGDGFIESTWELDVLKGILWSCIELDYFCAIELAKISDSTPAAETILSALKSLPADYLQSPPRESS